MQNTTGDTQSHELAFFGDEIPTAGDHRTRNRNHWRKQHTKRPWLFIDGEGITVADDEHLYIQFACMDSATQEVHEIVDAGGLGGYSILSWLLKMREMYRDNIMVIYGGSYDFNMWLKALKLPRERLEHIYSGEYTQIGYDFRVKWTRGKSFEIAKNGVSARIYDVVSFFQCTFVKACDSYLGDRFYKRDLVVSSKEKRGDFVAEEIDSVSEYNHAELYNGCLLMEELRERLYAVELYPSRWDGPGAIAAYLLSRENVKKARAKCPEPVALAARHAYAGGRFEVIRFGHVNQAAYEYDVNSAYPAALTEVPNLARGRWARYGYADPYWLAGSFSLWHIRWTNSNAKTWCLPQPLFRRLKTGVVHFPPNGEGWYWAPEARAAIKYFQQVLPDAFVEVLEVWDFIEDNPDDKPFGFIPELFTKRAALKKAENGAHVGIKLALNSLYGKLAQQVGWRMLDDGSIKIPPFHQLEWAGYATAWCRAKVLQAAMIKPYSVIAFETDAIFTSEDLEIPEGSGLGEWELIKFDNLTYMQSGTYYGDSDGKSLAAKSRGIDRGRMQRNECIDLMTQPLAQDRYVTVDMRRFFTLGIALAQDIGKWCKWLPVVKRVSLEPTGKRIHSPYCLCDINGGIELEKWHTTMCPTIDREMSIEYPVEWLSNLTTMAGQVFHELRNLKTEFELLDIPTDL